MDTNEPDPRVGEETKDASAAAWEGSESDSIGEPNDPPHMDPIKLTSLETGTDETVEEKEQGMEDVDSSLTFRLPDTDIVALMGAAAEKGVDKTRCGSPQESPTFQSLKDSGHLRIGSSGAQRKPLEPDMQDGVSTPSSSAKSPSRASMTTLQPPTTFFNTPDMMENSAFLTLTLEDDLLESTNLSPEHITALQSIVNPLFLDGSELHSHRMDSPRTSGLINTHASFQL